MEEIEYKTIISQMDTLASRVKYTENRWGLKEGYEKGYLSAFEDVTKLLKELMKEK